MGIGSSLDAVAHGEPPEAGVALVELVEEEPDDELDELLEEVLELFEELDAGEALELFPEAEEVEEPAVDEETPLDVLETHVAPAAAPVELDPLEAELEAEVEEELLAVAAVPPGAVAAAIARPEPDATSVAPKTTARIDRSVRARPRRLVNAVTPPTVNRKPTPKRKHGASVGFRRRMVSSLQADANLLWDCPHLTTDRHIRCAAGCVASPPRMAPRARWGGIAAIWQVWLRLRERTEQRQQEFD